MIRVLLADDHAIVLEGLRALLDGEPIALAKGLRAALEAAR